MQKAFKAFREVEAFTNGMPGPHWDITERILLAAVVFSVGGLVYVAVRFFS